MTAMIQLQEVYRDYRMGDQMFRALAGVDLEIHRGEFTAIMGPSGSGKSTMMHIIGCLDRPTGGVYQLDGYDVSRLTDDQLAWLRNRKIGFVFQSFYLLARMTALENVELPMVYAGVPSKERRERAVKALQNVGLGNRLHHRPNELSGGQQQRVSIARAMVNHPALLLTDEPTGGLDSRTTEEILDLFKELHAAGNTVIMVTHEADVAAKAHRVVHVRDGRIEGDGTLTPVSTGQL